MSKPSRGYRLHRPAEDSPSAVVFDSPHSGEYLPRHFRYACTRRDLMFLHDPYVNRLLSGVPGTGSPVLEALVHRSYIDLNRQEPEIEPSRLPDDWVLPVKKILHPAKNAYAFPFFAGPRTNRLTPIYNEAARLTAQDAENRLRLYYRPYYAALQALLEESRRRHGVALHLNIHSSHREPGQKHADIILGDLHGKACAPDIRQRLAHAFHNHGYSVDFNGPALSGGAIVKRMHNPAQGIHSVQVEIARDLYMDQEKQAYLPEQAARIQEMIRAVSADLRLYMAQRRAPSVPKT